MLAYVGLLLMIMSNVVPTELTINNYVTSTCILRACVQLIDDKTRVLEISNDCAVYVPAHTLG